MTTLAAQHAWSQGRIYGSIGRLSGADAELDSCKQHHALILTLSGASDFTGTRISGSSIYEGRDGSGCVSFIPAGAEKRGWYRNADLNLIVLEVATDFGRSWNLGDEVRSLQPFTNRRDSLLESLLWSLASEMQGGGADLPSLYVEHAAALAMSHLMRSARREQSPASSRGGLSQAKLRLVLEFIEENLGHDLSLSELGTLVGMGPDVLARNFKMHVGAPPYRYLMGRRMRRAEMLLVANDKSIAEIALEVGFSSQSHFTTQFSRLSSATPAAYRALHAARPSMLPAPASGSRNATGFAEDGSSRAA